jgi:hypothetical protein
MLHAKKRGVKVVSSFDLSQGIIVKRTPNRQMGFKIQIDARQNGTPAGRSFSNALEIQPKECQDSNKILGFWKTEPYRATLEAGGIFPLFLDWRTSQSNLSSVWYFW